MPTLIMSDAEFEAVKQIRPVLKDAQVAMGLALGCKINATARHALINARAKIEMILNARAEVA